MEIITKCFGFRKLDDLEECLYQYLREMKGYDLSHIKYSASPANKQSYSYFSVVLILKKIKE